jgi:hypothetical protein
VSSGPLEKFKLPLSKKEARAFHHYWMSGLLLLAYIIILPSEWKVYQVSVDKSGEPFLCSVCLSLIYGRNHWPKWMIFCSFRVFLFLSLPRLMPGFIELRTQRLTLLIVTTEQL